MEQASLRQTPMVGTDEMNNFQLIIFVILLVRHGTRYESNCVFEGVSRLNVAMQKRLTSLLIGPTIKNRD